MSELKKEGDELSPLGKSPDYISVQNSAIHSESRGSTPSLRFDRQFEVCIINDQKIIKAE